MLQEALNRYRLDGHLYSSSWDALGKNPLLNMLDLTSWGHVSGATIAHALISQAFLENKKKNTETSLSTNLSWWFCWPSRALQ